MHLFASILSMWRIQSGQVFKLAPQTPPAAPPLFQQLSEANMTVTNVIEVVVALALALRCLPVFPEAGMISHEGQTYPGRLRVDLPRASDQF
jgi:hypothetical protein